MKEVCLAARGFGKERGWDAPTKSAACPASHLRGVGILYPQDLVWGGPSPPFTQTHGLVVLPPPPPARPSRTPACQRGVPGLWGRVGGGIGGACREAGLAPRWPTPGGIRSRVAGFRTN